jgi:hypothetical protein
MDTKVQKKVFYNFTILLQKLNKNGRIILKMDFRAKGWEGVDCSHLFYDRIYGRLLCALY